MMTMMMKLLLIFIVANGALALKCLECNNMPREYQKSCPGSLPVNYGDTKEYCIIYQLRSGRPIFQAGVDKPFCNQNKTQFLENIQSNFGEAGFFHCCNTSSCNNHTYFLGVDMNDWTNGTEVLENRNSNSTESVAAREESSRSSEIPNPPFEQESVNSSNEVHLPSSTSSGIVTDLITESSTPTSPGTTRTFGSEFINSNVEEPSSPIPGIGSDLPSESSPPTTSTSASTESEFTNSSSLSPESRDPANPDDLDHVVPSGHPTLPPVSSTITAKHLTVMNPMGSETTQNPSEPTNHELDNSSTTDDYQTLLPHLYSTDGTSTSASEPHTNPLASSVELESLSSGIQTASTVKTTSKQAVVTFATINRASNPTQSSLIGFIFYFVCSLILRPKI